MRKFINKILYPIVKLYCFIVRPKTRGAKCVIQFGDEILMVRHTYGHKLWTLPGGFVKKRETLEEAARREVREEEIVEARWFLKNNLPKEISEYANKTLSVENNYNLKKL